jgi:hypothetical protein
MNATPEVSPSYLEQANALAALLGGMAAQQYDQETLPSRFRIDLKVVNVPNAAIYVFFSPYDAKGRIKIGCLWPAVKELDNFVSTPGSYLRPQQLDAHGYVSSITVAMSKSIRQIAADIERRLIPGYLAVLPRVHAGNA